MIRCRQTEGLGEVIAASPGLRHYDFELEKFVANDDNIVLSSDDNYGVFEYTRLPHVYTGHYFFGSARGKDALALSREMLSVIFNDYGAKVVRGITPVTHKGALWLTRRLGFTDCGVINDDGTPCHLFVLGGDDFNKGS